MSNIMYTVGLYLISFRGAILPLYDIMINLVPINKNVTLVGNKMERFLFKWPLPR